MSLADDTSRVQLLAIAQHSADVRASISNLIADVAPMFGGNVALADDDASAFHTLSTDELIDYLERGAASMKLFVDDFCSKVAPELDKPMTKLALKSIVRMFG